MAMINLAEKYAAEIEKNFTAKSFVQGNTAPAKDFSGVKTVKLYSLTTTPLNDYQRNGSNRYGDPNEIGDTVQELTMTQDKAFTGTVDKGNAADQTIKNKASAWLNAEIEERVTPETDKYAFKRFIAFGHVATVTAEPTQSNIHGVIAECVEWFDDHSIPESDRIIYIKAKMYKHARLAPEFIGVDKLGEASLAKGQVGELHGMRCIKVPSSYLPDSCYFIAMHKSAVIMPYKINDAKINTDPQGISGALIEGRQYYDAFVLATKADGVYALVKASDKLAAPTLTCATPGTAALTIACANADAIKYTLDGTDPRFSASALHSAGSVDTTKWAVGETVVRAVGFSANKFTSDVAKQAFTRA